MRKLIESTFVSLDGVVGSPERWALPFWDGENRNHAHAELAEYDAFLFGRVTYEKFAAAWSPVKGDPYLDKINGMRKYVASTTLKETTWNATLLQGDIVEEIRKLKDQPGKDIIKYGTSRLDRTLVKHKLIDEFRFSIFPIAVGDGPRLFEGIDTSELKLELKGSMAFKNGIVRLVYTPDPARS
jgi:dihydrofolate reductase